MKKIDFKKEMKELYRASAKNVSLATNARMVTN